jgi:hypothetical protein
MRAITILLLATMLAACGVASNGNNGQVQVNVHDLIMADDMQACVVPEAIVTALSAADGTYALLLSKGMPAIRVDTVSATELNKDVHELTCSATAHFHAPLDNSEHEQDLVYKLRPALDPNGGYVAEISAVGPVKVMIGAHVMWWEQSRKSGDADRGGTKKVASSEGNSESAPGVGPNPTGVLAAPTNCHAPEIGTSSAPIVSPPLGAVVVGTKRLQFYSAPNLQCPISGTFIIPNDQVVVYAQTDDGWLSVSYFGGKIANEVSGWVRAERLKTTGTMAPSQ